MSYSYYSVCVHRVCDLYEKNIYLLYNFFFFYILWCAILYDYNIMLSFHPIICALLAAARRVTRATVKVRRARGAAIWGGE